MNISLPTVKPTGRNRPEIRERSSAVSPVSKVRKVLVVEPSGRGNLCHIAAGVCHSLAQKNCNVTLITSTSYELACETSDFRVERLYTGKRGYFRYIVKMLRIIKRERPHVLHFHWFPFIELDWLFVVFLKKRWKMEVAYTAHHVLPHRKRIISFLIFSIVFTFLDRIISGSQAEAGVISDLFGVKRTKLSVIPQGNYNIVCRKKGISRKEARIRFGVEKRAKVLLFFGHLTQAKGIDLLLHAFTKSAKQDRSLKLLLAGEAPSVPALEKKIEHLGLKDQVIFHPGYVPAETVEWYFSAADLIVLPYLKDCNSPIVQLAYTFGRAVVASDRVQNRYLKKNGSSVIIPANNVDVLAKTMYRLLEDDGLRAEIEERTRKLSEKEFGWNRLGKKLLDAYSPAKVKEC